MTIVQKLWPSHKVAAVSLALAMLEVAIVWGAVAIAFVIRQPIPLSKITTSAWILGSLGSFVSAIVALIIDQRREVGLLSLIISVGAFFICGLPMVV